MVRLSQIPRVIFTPRELHTDSFISSLNTPSSLNPPSTLIGLYSYTKSPNPNLKSRRERAKYHKCRPKPCNASSPLSPTLGTCSSAPPPDSHIQLSSPLLFSHLNHHSRAPCPPHPLRKNSSASSRTSPARRPSVSKFGRESTRSTLADILSDN